MLLIGWSKFPSRQDQLEPLPRPEQWDVISMEFLCQFLRRVLSVAASRNFGCFLRLPTLQPLDNFSRFFFLAKEQPKHTSSLWLWLLIGRFMINVLIWIYGPSYNAFYSPCFAEKQCLLYEPPDNGALTCRYIGSDPVCSVQCQSGYDFVYTPPYVYFCAGGEWNYRPIAHNNSILPWPDCASKYIAIKDLVALMAFSYG